jgi:hypothetical protein
VSETSVIAAKADLMRTLSAYDPLRNSDRFRTIQDSVKDFASTLHQIVGAERARGALIWPQ